MTPMMPNMWLMIMLMSTMMTKCLIMNNYMEIKKNKKLKKKFNSSKW